ncbi:Maf-like protein [Stappia sp. GBMRC 2046]|uniref:Nucleoside triphosphate pyrophosphatase n=1 Tax=Stappia sediminis TaxID=2692190 RepID=A0A7X3LTH1_9HYPH|nr:Maf-like protein [Stappia sediminis]MXN64812.1 Maf-like protein [Stappia sediminis]
MPEIILASGSRIRASLLENAGIDIRAIPADLDERAVEAPLLNGNATVEDIAAVLSEAKALEVSERERDALVIGADQMLEFEGERLTKPENMEAARRQLLALSAKTHQLHSAVAVVRNGETLWRHVSTASLTMRDLSPGFVGRYLADVGDEALSSVGAYQLEGRGIQLFEKIDGDYFTILGLPMLPLLSFLRDCGAIDG